ncbi:MAG: tetratricopeptide repeat protein, partial [Bacteroidota bacterium]|nr:tetratricopeptide repeat protein [Bacteroidota bacterium]
MKHLRLTLTIVISIFLSFSAYSQKSGENYYKKGTAKSIAGLYKEALEDFDKAIKLSPEEVTYL